MNNEERIQNLKENEYQELFGIKKATFDKMLEIYKQNMLNYIKKEAVSQNYQY